MAPVCEARPARIRAREDSRKEDHLPIRLGPLELGIILLIVILLFGAGRIGKVAGEVGRGFRELRKGLKDEEPTPPADITEPKK